MDDALKAVYDGLASNLIPNDTELFIGWSGCCLRSLERAKHRNMKTMVVRGSTHIKHQVQLLKEECEKWGLENEIPTAWYIERELQEYELTDYIFNQTPHVKRTFLEHGINEQKLVQFPTGVDVSKFFPRPKKDDVFRVVYCGALSLRKGIIYLLKAFETLNLPNAELVLFGVLPAGMKPLLERYLGGNIIYRGEVSSDVLAQEMSQGSVFCFPSLEEGQAAVLAQAMACGLPLIATRESGAEVFLAEQEHGWYVPPADESALEEKLLWAYEHQEEMAQMGSNAIERIHQGYTWSHYGENLRSAVERICTAQK